MEYQTPKKIKNKNLKKLIRKQFHQLQNKVNMQNSNFDRRQSTYETYECLFLKDWNSEKVKLVCFHFTT